MSEAPPAPARDRAPDRRRGPRGPYQVARVELPYGFRVHYQARINGRLEEKWFRSKGTLSHATDMAQIKAGFIRVTKLEPFTREQWLRTFGNTDLGPRNQKAVA